MDTLRADRVGRVTEGRSLTPALDRLASQGGSFDQLITPVPRTGQSVASILTGLHPIHHRVRGLFWPLPGDCGPTLASELSASGYATAALTSNLVLRPGQGFERGFALYDNPRPRWEGNGAEATVTDAIAWIEADHAPGSGIEARGGAPWFLWLHLLDPHWPYEPAPPFDAVAGGVTADDRLIFGREAPYELREEGRGPVVPADSDDSAHRDLVFAGAPPETLAHLTALYDGEVAATDAAIGRLLDALDRLGLAEGTLVVVTSDHGESLGEHGYFFAHGEYLYDETLRVPGIVRAPGLVPPGRRLARLSRVYDLMPTILALLDLPEPGRLDGVSRAAELCAPASSGPAGSPGSDRSAPIAEDSRERAVYLESDRDLLRPGNPKRFLPGYAGCMRGWRDERFKLIRIPTAEGEVREAYDLRNDPREEQSLDAAGFAAAAGLHPVASSLAEWERRAAESVPSVPAGGPGR